MSKPQMAEPFDSAAYLLALSSALRSLNAAVDVEQVHAHVTDAAVALLAAERGFLILNVSPSGGRRTAAARAAGREDLLPVDADVSIEIVESVLGKGWVLAAGDIVAAGEPRAILCAPLTVQGHSTGVIYVDRPAGAGLYSAVDIEIFSAFAAAAAIAVENARLSTALQQAAQDKAKFVSAVTHELRIPMTSIKGYTDLLRQGAVGPVNEAQTGFLGVIRNNVDRMAALVSDLADLSRIETGRLKVNLQAVSPAGCINDALLEVRPRIEAKGQLLELELPADLPALFADAGRATQVIAILLNNAWNYTPQGGCIRLSASAEPGMVCFTIADDGIGISAEDQKLLFTPFFRSDDPKVREQPGWGLGLSVARGLVEFMGGQMGCESQPGRGATFRFTLPVYSHA